MRLSVGETLVFIVKEYEESEIEAKFIWYSCKMLSFVKGGCKYDVS